MACSSDQLGSRPDSAACWFPLPLILDEELPLLPGRACPRTVGSLGSVSLRRPVCSVFVRLCVCVDGLELTLTESSRSVSDKLVAGEWRCLHQRRDPKAS